MPQLPLAARCRTFLGRFSGGALAFGLWHFAAAVFACWWLEGSKDPAQMLYTSKVAAGLKPSLVNIIQMGLWKGAAIHLAVSVLMLLTFYGWGRGTGVKLQLAQGNTAQWRSRTFLMALGLILLLGTGLRLPRMSLSYWGDEGWAAEYYVHGQYDPVVEGQPQGELKFEPHSWSRALWNDQNGGNHYLFSVTQMATLKLWRWWKGLPPTAFAETISRLPPMAAGLASLVVAAFFGAWLGHRWLGLLFSLLLALHPWHVRYSTEARGYSMTFVFLLCLLWLLMLALQQDRWRWWGGVALTSFLTVWSWKLSVLTVGAFALVSGLAILGARSPSWPQRFRSLSRLLLAFLTGGALTAWLAMPPALQAADVTARFQRMGKPMDAGWLRNSLSGIHLGVPWQQSDPANLTEAPFSRAMREHPTLATAALTGCGLLFLLGLATLLRRQPYLAAAVLAAYAAAIAGAAYFKWGLRVEWIYWYFFPLVLPSMLLLTAGIGRAVEWWKSPGFTPRSVSAALLLLGTAIGQAAVLLPALKLNLSQPYESHREAFQLTRGRHEPWAATGPYTGQSKIVTCYMGRQIHLYDPRALENVRELPELEKIMRQVDAEGGEFYYTVGILAYSEATSPDLLQLLRDEQHFEKIATLWAQESLHTLHVFHYKRGSWSRDQNDAGKG